MNNKRQADKKLKLSDTDRRVLTAHSSPPLEQTIKTKTGIQLDKKNIKLF